MTARIGWHDARRRAEAAGQALPPQTVPLQRCIGRRLAADLSSPIDLPHFASSAMDGWLTVGDGPWTITDAIPRAGEARAVVTGGLIPEGLVPEGTTAVLRSESAVASNGVVHAARGREPRPGEHIRIVGTEASRGELLIAAGTVLNPAHLALAASTGVDSLQVQAEPEVAMVFTGDEVVTAGPPAAGQVRDSFGVQLPALFESLGARVIGTTRTRDGLDVIADAIDHIDAPLIVTTGGTGSSSADHMHDALRRLGAEVLFDGVAMRPGGPTVVAGLPDGRLVACLPGNPLAAMVVALTLCEPLIAGLAGRPMRPTRRIDAPDLNGRAGTTVLVPYSLSDGSAEVSPWTGSGMMRGLSAADGLLVVPQEGTARGGTAESVDLPWVLPPRG